MVQPVVRCAAAVPTAASPAAANEWEITLENSSVDDPAAASGGAALLEGLFYAFVRSAQPGSSSESAGVAMAGAAETVEDLKVTGAVSQLHSAEQTHRQGHYRFDLAFQIKNGSAEG
jgi:hypothetical protein